MYNFRSLSPEGECLSPERQGAVSPIPRGGGSPSSQPRSPISPPHSR